MGYNVKLGRIRFPLYSLGKLLTRHMLSKVEFVLTMQINDSHGVI